MLAVHDCAGNGSGGVLRQECHRQQENHEREQQRLGAQSLKQHFASLKLLGFTRKTEGGHARSANFARKTPPPRPAPLPCVPLSIDYGSRTCQECSAVISRESGLRVLTRL